MIFIGFISLSYFGGKFKFNLINYKLLERHLYIGQMHMRLWNCCNVSATGKHVYGLCVCVWYAKFGHQHQNKRQSRNTSRNRHSLVNRNGSKNKSQIRKINMFCDDTKPWNTKKKNKRRRQKQWYVFLHFSLICNNFLDKHITML